VAAQVTLQAELARPLVVDLEPEAAKAPAWVAIDHVAGRDAVASDHLHEVAGGVNAIGILVQT